MKGYESAKGIVLQPDQIALEFGSERNDGSTSFLTALWPTQDLFITIDPHPTVFTHRRMTGEEFLQNEMPNISRKVRFAYLDCFDWDYGEAFDDPLHYQRQIEEYAGRGVALNNTNSQATHLLICQLLEPFTAKRCLLVFDDTWSTESGFDGKGGTAVPWLLEQGYKVKKEGEKWLAVEK